MLVIGCGNCLRGDDGVGVVVAQQLSEAGWEAIACHQLTLELAEPISRAAFVAFVDACVDVPHGMVRTQMVEPLAASANLWTHQVDPALLLALARDWYGQAPPAVLVGVGGQAFELSESLSVDIQNTLPTIFKILQKFNILQP
jgi:hydrogenase maturation protease